MHTAEDRLWNSGVDWTLLARVEREARLAPSKYLADVLAGLAAGIAQHAIHLAAEVKGTWHRYTSVNMHNGPRSS